jgi:phosphoglycolate phosphatase
MKRCADGKAEEVLRDIDTVLFDMDGVLWHGNGAVAGSGRALQHIARLGKRLVFVTNNSSKARSTFSDKLYRVLGAEAGPDVCATHFTASHVFTSAVAAAQVVGARPNAKVYVVGEAGLFTELRAGGVDVVGEDDSACVLDVQAGQAAPEVDRTITDVVVGFDGCINYYKLAYAARCIREIPSCRLVACNTDRWIPSAGGVLLPGTGCMVQAVSAAAGVPPAIVCGKPAPMLWSIVRNAFDDKQPLDPARTLMIGDSLETDTAFGRACGMRTLLVLTGFTSRETLQAMPADHPACPAFFTASLGSIF